MRELRLIGVDDDGEHLLLAETEDSADGFRLPIEDSLRSALRRTRPRPSADVGSVPVPDELRPRDVQALLRAGASVEDVAERAGWTTEKVLRYEGPIRAERDHVAGMARGIPVSGATTGRADSTFGQRVEHRLDGRGVVAEDIVWDSWRGHDGAWTVVCSFPAGGRQRQASWHFDVRGRALDPADDEARWLGEDETSSGPRVSAARDASVYDVEAEGGLDAGPRPSVRRVRGGRTSATAIPTHPAGAAAAPEPAERPVDLVAAMRERSRNRKRKGRSSAPHDFPDDAAPQQKLDTSGEAPPLGSHPRDEELVADPPAKPSVDELGHDPVTGTADLFADLEPESPPAAAEPASEETAEEPSDDDGPAATSADAEPSLDEEQDEEHEEELPAAADEPVAELHDERVASDDAEPSSADRGPAIPDRPSSTRKGRPSVPSWDDIMFGRRPGTN